MVGMGRSPLVGFSGGKRLHYRFVQVNPAVFGHPAKDVVCCSVSEVKELHQASFLTGTLRPAPAVSPGRGHPGHGI